MYVGRRRGTYWSFEKKTFGANLHTIEFDDGSTETLKLKDESDWRFVDIMDDEELLAELDELEAEDLDAQLLDLGPVASASIAAQEASLHATFRSTGSVD